MQLDSSFYQHLPGGLSQVTQSGKLMTLPARHGGLGLPNPAQMTSNLEGSVRASEPLSELIQAQTAALGDVCQEVKRRRYEERAKRRKHLNDEAQLLLPCLDTGTRLAVEQVAEKGAST